MLLVIGPTCAGKSSYVESLRREAAARGEVLEVHFGFEIRRGKPVPSGPHDVVHVNLLRGKDEADLRRISPASGKELSELIPAADEIVVLGAPRTVLLERAAGRTDLEPGHEAYADKVYQSERWADALDSPHLAQRLEQLALALDGSGRPVRYLCSHHGDEPVAVSRWQFPLLAGDGAEELCAAGHPEPQLDLGARTYQADYREGAAGSMRSLTLASALRMPLVGSQVLDIGCAEGAAALSAARMGARVTGLEPKPGRYRKARRIAEAIGTPLELHNLLLDDYDAPRNSFDVVLALNVIHHVRDPFAFLDRAASLTRSHLVLEYPGLRDPKFGATVPDSVLPEDGLPLLAVSLPEEQDQTFVYTPAAFERYLVDILGAFRRHDVVESPIPGRWLSVFSRKVTKVDLGSALTRQAAQRRRLERRAKEVERLRNRVGALERRVAEMERSRSWRITAPLRAISGARR